MAKLYFKYGAMGSSKSAQALTTKFNYEEKGMTVWLIKPGTDTRDGADIIKSRIGLQQKAQVIHPDDDIIKTYHEAGSYDVIIADEAQFMTPEQIDGLRWLVDEKDIPVLCFGLRTDFLTHFFPTVKVSSTIPSSALGSAPTSRHTSFLEPGGSWSSPTRSLRSRPFANADERRL